MGKPRTTRIVDGVHQRRCPDPDHDGPRWLVLDCFARDRTQPSGVRSACRDCHARRGREKHHADPEPNRERARRNRAINTARADGADLEAIAAAEARARRMMSDHEPLRVEDLDSEYDVGVGNVHTPQAKKASAQASREKRQEFNARMAENTETLKRAAATAHQRGGDVLSAMSGDAGDYIGGLAEQERRFSNRRLARTISLAQANEALALQSLKQVAAQFFRDKVTATGFGTRVPEKPSKRSTVLLLSDLHLGAELSSLDEPMPFRAIEEARRLEYVMRETIDYKPHYRKDSELVLLIIGDIIEGQLGHQLGAGAPLAEQKAIAWMYLRRMIAEFSRAFPRVRVVCQPGNHGRDKQRHPGRATWRKWDGHEFEVYWALREMCSALRNVTFDIPFRAVSIVDLHGQNLLTTHADTEIELGHPDSAAEKNARALDRLNSTRLFGCEFAAGAFGHYHSGRVVYGNVTQVWNGALVPPNGHARASGYIGEATGQFLFESVPGHIVGDVRFLGVGPAQDRDERLGKIIEPFRFPTE